MDAFDLPENFDLVYLDPPYMSGKNNVNYLDRYHFLEGILTYDSWKEKIDYSKKNLKMKPDERICTWQKKSEIKNLIGNLISKFSGSVIVLSYRSDGYPSTREIINLFKKYKGQKPRVYSIPYKYALSQKLLSEKLFVAE